MKTISIVEECIIKSAERKLNQCLMDAFPNNPSKNPFGFQSFSLDLFMETLEEDKRITVYPLTRVFSALRIALFNAMREKAIKDEIELVLNSISVEKEGEVQS